MTDLWLFVEHGNTWTRAEVPQGIKTARDLVNYIQRGGRIVSPWMQLPDRVRFAGCRILGLTVLARLEN